MLVIFSYFPLAKDVFSKLETRATSSALDKFERKVTGKCVVWVGKWFT